MCAEGCAGICHQRRKPSGTIDYLLARWKVSTVIWGHSETKLECSVAAGLRAAGLESAKGFGASDCRCPSHLFYSARRGELKAQVEAEFRGVGVSPRWVGVEHGQAKGSDRQRGA